MNRLVIRHVEERDLPALLTVYNHYVLHSSATFTIEPVTMTDRKVWFEGFAHTGRHQCFVAERDGEAIGWASSGRIRPRAAYDTSVETSIYLAPDAVGQGLGKRLYQTLMIAMAREDIHRIYGVVTMPNDASVALHTGMGFQYVGTLHEVGRKFGRYWDTAYFEKVIGPQNTE
jgi:phosphinothricin acetyltransferase